jgi:phenylalanyl-tRNA synthetase beta chain
VAEIKEAVQHPDADRLRVCKVDAGTGGLLQIVCGAPNARVGIKVPCALVGAELPPGEDGKPFMIKVGKLRGVESHGMLCSARELKLSEDHGGLLELPADAPLGQNIRDYLNLDDTLFTLKLTPNLAHCLSVYGIAREVSALTGAPLQPLSEAQVPVTASGCGAGYWSKRPICVAASAAASSPASTPMRPPPRGW